MAMASQTGTEQLHLAARPASGGAKGRSGKLNSFFPNFCDARYDGQVLQKV
jgi:hypothetical protein